MSEPGTKAAESGGPRQHGPPTGSPESPGPLGDLNAMIEDIRRIGVRLFADAFALLQAQWQLSAYVLTGSVGIWSLRIKAFVVVALLSAVTWVFVNMTIWELVAGVTRLRFAAPLSLVLLNGFSAWAVHCWQKRLVLQ